jgi:hypothetical protein
MDLKPYYINLDMKKILNTLCVLVTITLVACSDENNKPADTQVLSEKPVTLAEIKPRPLPNPDKNAYFGDLHVHTENSFDAYTFGTIATPADAYKYAQGHAILHPSGFLIQLGRPLDFYAVTDHGVFMGLMKEAADTSSEFSKYEFTKPLHNLNQSTGDGIFSLIKRSGLFRPFGAKVREGLADGSVDGSLIDKVGKSAWQQTIKAADNAYIPGIFTTFAAYEYTSSFDLYDKYLHRNVIFRDTKNLPERIFTRTDSQDPEALWNWMNGLRTKDVDSLAIPHNSNISGGAAFALNDYNGGPIDEEYASNRSRNEPLVEITQVKGTSETHPLLSKNDEWAAFEVKSGMEEEKLLSNIAGSYVRDAYLRGLSLSEQGLTNPYQFGLIGSSDSHVGGPSDSEETFFSKVGILDGTAELRGSIPFQRFYGTFLKVIRPNIFKEVDGETYLSASERLIHFSASGLAGVWAEENTREAIFDAFVRKETFATSGPRIKVRFFAGYDLEDSKLDDLSLIQDAYANSIPMGGTLNIESNRNPTFLVWAIADPLGAPLQRTQIIKGWLEDGEHKEKVYDVACSDGLVVDPETYRCPDNKSWVDLSNCSISGDSGAREMKVLWQDPEFKMDQEAFYYARILENPVCRWSTWDAIRIGAKPRSDIPSTIQERAWSSPIWLTQTF